MGYVPPPRPSKRQFIMHYRHPATNRMVVETVRASSEAAARLLIMTKLVNQFGGNCFDYVDSIEKVQI